MCILNRHSRFLLPQYLLRHVVKETVRNAVKHLRRTTIDRDRDRYTNDIALVAICCPPLLMRIFAQISTIRCGWRSVQKYGRVDEDVFPAVSNLALHVSFETSLRAGALTRAFAALSYHQGRIRKGG